MLLSVGLQHANEDVEKMLLGNKCDMEDKRAISRERGEAIARQHGIRFLETSAKANINVERAFYELSEAILDKVSRVRVMLLQLIWCMCLSVSS